MHDTVVKLATMIALQGNDSSDGTPALPNDIMPPRERMLLPCFRITKLSIYTVSQRELVHLCCRPHWRVDSLRMSRSQPDLHRYRDIPPPPSVLFPLNDPFHRGVCACVVWDLGTAKGISFR